MNTAVIISGTNKFDKNATSGKIILRNKKIPAKKAIPISKRKIIGPDKRQKDDLTEI